MLLGNDERMHGGLRIDVVEGQRLIVLVHNLGRNTLLNDFTE
jgi:hypothetical protein